MQRDPVFFWKTPLASASQRWLPGLLLLVVLLSTLTACSSNAGIFASTSWQAGALQNEQLQALTVDPNNLNDIYAGDSRDGVFVSTNAGSTWKKLGVGLPPAAIFALAFDIPGKKLYAATAAGLFVSADGARNWSAVKGLPGDSYTALAFNVQSPQSIYVGTALSGVLKSDDGGSSWVSIKSGLPTSSAVTSLLYDPNSRQLWVAFASALYRSDTNGAGWREMDRGLPANVGINTLASADGTSSQSDQIFAGTNHGFFLSADQGQHWAQSRTSLADLHIQAILADVTQATVVYAATNIGVLRSQDNGQTWQQVASGLPTNLAIKGLVQGGDNFGQLLVVSHGVYLYPGTSSVFDASRLIPLLIVLLFFVLLSRLMIARRKRSQYSISAVPADQSASAESEPESTAKRDEFNE